MNKIEKRDIPAHPKTTQDKFILSVKSKMYGIKFKNTESKNIDKAKNLGLINLGKEGIKFSLVNKAIVIWIIPKIAIPNAVELKPDSIINGATIKMRASAIFK